MEIPKWTSGPICTLPFLSGPVSNFLFRIETSANKVEITKTKQDWNGFVGISNIEEK